MRYSTGIPALDAHLGGGLLPGTLTVVMGATGIGKTQLGLQFANAGLEQEGKRGILFDMTSRGDSQSHAVYAQRMFGWQLTPVPPQQVDLLNFFEAAQRHGDYLHVFDHRGRRVTRRDLDFEEQRQWQAELNARLAASIAFFYGNFIQGVRRCVIDGIEPTERPSDSIQFDLFEYIYQQILRKDPDWVARDLFRQHYRTNADAVAQHSYDPSQLACLLLSTSQEAMLDDLISRPLDEGDVLSNANTIIYLGKVREHNRLAKGLYIAKHRGSSCSDEIIRYDIDAQGLRLS